MSTRATITVHSHDGGTWNFYRSSDAYPSNTKPDIRALAERAANAEEPLTPDQILDTLDASMAAAGYPGTTEKISERQAREASTSYNYIVFLPPPATERETTLREARDSETRRADTLAAALDRVKNDAAEARKDANQLREALALAEARTIQERDRRHAAEKRLNTYLIKGGATPDTPTRTERIATAVFAALIGATWTSNNPDANARAAAKFASALEAELDQTNHDQPTSNDEADSPAGF